MRYLGKDLSYFTDHELIDIYLYYKAAYEDTGIKNFQTKADKIMEYLNSFKGQKREVAQPKRRGRKSKTTPSEVQKVNKVNGCYDHPEFEPGCYQCLYNKHQYLIRTLHAAADNLLSVMGIISYESMLQWLEKMIDSPTSIVDLSHEIHLHYKEIFGEGEE